MIAERDSIHITLILSLARYDEVIDAYLSGLAEFVAAGSDPSTVHSAASFFVTRVDTDVARRLEATGTEEASELRGAGRRWRRPSWPISCAATGSRATLGTTRCPRRPLPAAAVGLDVHQPVRPATTSACTSRCSTSPRCIAAHNAHTPSATIGLKTKPINTLTGSVVATTARTQK